MHSLSATSEVARYLHISKETYEKTVGHTQVHFVMGNEAADMDSVISSIAFAYLLQKENPNEFYVPLINLQKNELSLRPDVLYVLDSHHIPREDLLFLNDVEFDDLSKNDLLRLNIVDHNRLRPKWLEFSPFVERIVDHHADEKMDYPLMVMKNITVIGSTASLIAEYFQKSIAAKMDSEIALMLLAPILLDTGNLKNGITTQRDIEAAKYLQSHSKVPSKYYDILFDKKNDVSYFTPEMSFSKDYKEFLDGPILYGMASIPLSIYWGRTDIPKLIPDLEKFAQEKGLTFLILLMHNPDKDPKRVILVYSRNEELTEAFKEYVQEDEVLSNEFELLKQPKDQRVALYGSNKITSRKQIQPLFHFSESEYIMNVLQLN